ncbi:MAG: FHA domain-containing protein [Limisphaerales bacterium]
MVQLNILSGKKTGGHIAVRHFPFHVGRAAQNDLQLEDDGVWDRHLALEFQKKTGFNLAAAPNTIAAVNGKSVQNAILRNGDIITIGSAKLQFWLAAVKQRGLRLRELFVWTLLILITLGQIALVYLLE